MLIFETSNGKIFLNTTSKNLHLDEGIKIPKQICEACDTLQNYPNNIPLNSIAYAAMEILATSEVCLSPNFFLQPKGRPVSRHINEYFVSTSFFSAWLHEELESVGAFVFLEKLDGGAFRHANGQVMRLLAPWAMSAFGNESLTDVPREFIHALVDCYRSPDGRTWNEEAFGRSEVIRQCARNIVIGLSQIFDDKTLLPKASSDLRECTRSKTWTELQGTTDPLVAEIVLRREAYLLNAHMKPTHIKQVAMDLIHWLSDAYPGLSLTEILQLPDRPLSFSRFLELRAGKATKYSVSQISRVKRMLDAFTLQIAGEQPLLTLHPLITEREITSMKSDAPKVGRPTQARSRPLPEKLFALAKVILDEGENGWPAESGYFTVKVLSEGDLKSIYCPVIPVLLRSAFDIPLRIVQWRRLDSGEGDSQRFNAETGVWERNDGPHAGAWARSEGKAQIDYPTRGYAYRYPAEEGEITGFFVNSNKTGQPYTIPWQHHEVHARLWKLRKWQEENNHISLPISPEQYTDKETPIVTKAKLPDIYPLFRLFPSKLHPFRGRIPTSSEIDHAWQALMAEVERRWNIDNQDEQIQVVQRQETTNQPQRSIYNLHGLRVRGLTDLYRSGIPLELISKMVAGHATLVMTLYYIKFDPSRVNDLLEASAIETRAQAQREMINEFKQWDVDQARQRTIGLTDATLEDAVLSSSKVEYCNVDIGFCPFDCTRCSDGGPMIRSEKRKIGPDKDMYGPVPGGARNCVVCRHFVTGPEWLNQLEWFGSKLCEKRRYLAQKEIIIIEKVEQLENQLKNGSISKAMYRQSLDALQSELLPLKNDQEIIESSIFNVEFFLEACVRIMASDKNLAGGNFVAASEKSVVQYLETTEFDSAAMITAQSRVYPIFNDERVEAYRDRHLNRVLFNAGITPPDLAIEITELQRRNSLDLLSKFLLERASREERAKLTNGTLKLQDLGYQTEVQELVTSVIGKSMLSPQDSLLLESLQASE